MCAEPTLVRARPECHGSPESRSQPIRAGQPPQEKERTIPRKGQSMLAPKGGVVEDVLDGGMILIHDPAQDVHSSLKPSWLNRNLQPAAFQNKMQMNTKSFLHDARKPLCTETH